MEPDKLYIFTKRICPRPNHFCSGRGIQDREDKQKDFPICQYYDDQAGCLHKYNPKNTQKIKKG